MSKRIESWYDKKSKSWVTQVKDENDFQVGDAHYNGTKAGRDFSEKQLRKEHEINEDAPINVAGTNQVAGIRDGEDPGIRRKRLPKFSRIFFRKKKNGL